VREYEKVFAMQEKKLTSKANDSDAHLTAAECKAKIGNAMLKAGQVEKAEAAFRQSLNLAKPFLSAETPDLTALYATADSDAGLGDIEVLQATSRLPKSANSSEHWRRAQSWYSQSLTAWEKVPLLRRKRAKSSVVVADFDTVTKSLRRCDAALSVAK
jgi:tetratricopeptide (TPR) repeat protein